MQTRVPTVLTLYAFATLGVFLIVAPWTTLLDQAALSLSRDGGRSWLTSGWVRGAISGLGAIDLVCALRIAYDTWRRPHPNDTGHAG
jgi:hypothetical protein